MKLSDLGLACLQFFEDYRAQAYQDQHGVWTCGFGHTGSDVTEETVCGLQYALQWLRNDVLTAESAVTRLASRPLTQGEYDALVSFTYNVGEGAFSTSTLLRLVNQHSPDAQAEFLRWDHVAGHENTGLMRRRLLERALYLS